MRTAAAIKSDIATAKARFDRAVFASPFYDRYSQASRLHQWKSLQTALVPLVAELVEAEKHEFVMRERRMKKEYLLLRKRRVMKGKAAA